MVVGWYGNNWWVGDEEDQADLLQRYGCTVEHRRQVLDYMIAARKAGRLLIDPSRVADSGIVRLGIRRSAHDSQKTLFSHRMERKLWLCMKNT